NMLDRQIPMRLRERTLSPQPVPSPLNLPLIPNPRIPASNRRPINPKPLRTLPRRTKRLLIPTLSKKRRRRLPHLTISRLPNPSLPPSPSQNLRPPMSHTQVRTQRKDRVPTPLTIRLDRITPTIRLTHNPSPPHRHKRMEPDPPGGGTDGRGARREVRLQTQPRTQQHLSDETSPTHRHPTKADIHAVVVPTALRANRPHHNLPHTTPANPPTPTPGNAITTHMTHMPHNPPGLVELPGLVEAPRGEL